VPQKLRVFYMCEFFQRMFCILHSFIYELLLGSEILKFVSYVYSIMYIHAYVRSYIYMLYIYIYK